MLSLGLITSGQNSRTNSFCSSVKQSKKNSGQLAKVVKMINGQEVYGRKIASEAQMIDSQQRY